MNRKQRRKAPKKKSRAPSKSGLTQAFPVGGNVLPTLAPHHPVVSQSAGVDDTELLFHMAKSHHQAGQLKQAEEMYSRLLVNHPKHAGSLHLLGLIRHQQGRSAEALDLIKKALKINPKDAEAHNNKGNVLRRLGRAEEAVTSFRKAIKLAPDFVGAYSNLALTYRQLGQFEKAINYYRQAIKKDPLKAEAWSGLASAGRLNLQDDEVEAAEQVLATGNLPDGDRRHISYALGKHYDAAQNWNQAFHYYQMANDLGSEASGRHVIQGIFETMVKEPVDFLDQLNLGQDTDPLSVTPVFVVGMPRSGTTLVDQILVSHSDVLSGGETNLIDAGLRDVFQHIQSDKKHLADCLNVEQLQKIRRDFSMHVEADIAQHGKTPTHYVDKSLLNLAYVPIILKLFPDARIVYCCRNPLDTCLSIYFTDFKQAYDYTTTQVEIGEVYCASLEVMKRWQARYGHSIQPIQYEGILDSQESETENLLAFCGLPWNPDCLRFFETNRQVATPSAWQVRQPIFSTSRDRWKNYEEHLSDLIATLKPCI